MSVRDDNDFSSETIRTLGQRAGYLCSFPKCERFTIGPHSDPNKAINNGQACHIRGARPDPNNRYDPNMTPDQRRNISNGIWMCPAHGTLIDKDEKKYTAQLLYSWKAEHEKTISARLEGGIDPGALFEKVENRVEEAEKIGSQKDTVRLLREKMDIPSFLEFLRRESESKQKESVEINRERFELAYLTGHIEEARRAIDNILKVLPDDLYALTRQGQIFDLRGELGRAEENYRRVLKLSRGKKDEVGQAVAYGNLGNIYRTQGDLDQAKEMYEKSLTINKKLGRLKGMAIDYTNVGNVYFMRDALDEAEEMYKKAMSINEKLGNWKGKAIQYNNLGLIYKGRGDLERAEEMHKKSLTIYEKAGEQEGIASNYGNLGLIYSMQGDLGRAEEMHKKSLVIEEKLGRLEGMASEYGNLGNVYLTRKDLERAEEMHKKALVINEKLNFQEGMANQYGNLGILQELRKDYAGAKRDWSRAVEIYKKIGMPHMIKKTQDWLDKLPPIEG